MQLQSQWSVIVSLAIGQNPRTGSRYSCIDLSRVILCETLIKDLSISSRVTIASRTRFTPFQPGRVRFDSRYPKATTSCCRDSFEDSEAGGRSDPADEIVA